ncbi:MAG: beta-lactamase family protein [Actinomycetota bacterium]|nr:beta-lactamase family protein [Actinomycetota bacterium]MDQ2955895.1 beta-lactamase family protein [Actinomycetota bacterium]
MELDAALDRFSESAVDRRLGIDGVQVLLDDGQSASRRWGDDIRRDVFSVSKTITSLAIGMLEEDGLLTLDDPVLKHLPELADTAAPGSDAMTVRHLLSMTAGNGYRWLDDDGDHPGDPARDFLATPLVAEPGAVYAYRGTNSYVLGRIVHAVTGQDLRDFLLPRLFHPLNIRNPQWNRCPLGFPLAAIGLQLRTSEIGRIAQLLLHRGSFHGQQLVAEDYLARMISQTTETGRAEPDNRTYGLHVWLCSRDRAWRMDGIYGQFGIMLPEHGACISVTAHCLGPTTDILDAVWQHLVPALA